MTSGTRAPDVLCDRCGSRFGLIDEAAETRESRGLSTIGHFQVLDRIGTGAAGTVWKCHDTKLDRLVAIKVPRSERSEPVGQEDFFREARAAAQLHHPNIVSVYEVGREDSLIYIVSAFIEGVSLADWLKENRLPPWEAARLCQQLAEALDHTHQVGVIHRDVKPQNILLDRSGVPHLTDFGLARREASEVTMTLEGHVLGTPAYMSPEQARGAGHQADARSDVYSLGAVLFHVLTGDLPFRGSSRTLLHQVIHDDPPSPRRLCSHVPKDLETICLKCLEKEPAKRYQTARDVGEALGRFLQGELIGARAVGRGERFWRRCRRNPLVTGLVAGAVLVLVGGLVATLFL